MTTLEIIVGPMFSGKTTKLIEKYKELNKQYKCLVINNYLDTRYGNTQVVNHDGLAIDCFYLENLSELLSDKYINYFNESEYIFINEAQFFSNLKNHVLNIINKYKKNIILCGLDLDYKKDNFGEILDLKDYASKFIKLSGKCSICNNKSIYTHRLVDNNKQILIGNTNYIPTCEKCWNKLNHKI